MKRMLLILLMISLVVATAPTVAAAASITDSESATHAADAGQSSIVDTYSFPGFKVIQFELPVLSIYSYLLISGNEALMIDPVRDVDFYLQTARKENVQIKGIYLSHSHADFVAGHMELKAKIDGPIYQSHLSGVKYDVVSVDEKTDLRLGKVRLKFMDTPGHTPDGMCLAVYSDETARHMPELIFSGDVLFVGSVGRPDLMGGTTSAAWLAEAMYTSWTDKLSKLDDQVKVFPAHGAGSLCGAHLSSDPYTTIGRERTSNPYLKHTRKSEFVTALLEGLPEAPQYFKYNAAMNKRGPKMAHWNKPLSNELPATEDLTDMNKYYVVDLRDADAFARGHIPNSVNIAARGRLETWIGIMVPWKSRLVLTGERAEIVEALNRIQRVGYQAKYIRLATWENAGLKLTRSSSIAPRELYSRMQAGDAPLIVDVRLPSEWIAMRISATILNYPLNHLAELSAQLNPKEPVVVVCNSAYRSSMAVGILERQGFTAASSMKGGSEAWINAGLPVYEAAKSNQIAMTPKNRVHLPERLSPDALNRMMIDLPDSFEMVDIRPPQMFEDFQLPGAFNDEPANVIANTAYLGGSVPLVIVDRDGSLAMAVGGILSQKTQRPIKVLHGGLAAYWNQFYDGGMPKGRQQTTPSAAAPTHPTMAPSTAPAPKPVKTASARRPAGC